MRKNIGICSNWGFGRGRAIVSLCWAKMMLPEYNVFILQEGYNDILDDRFDIDVDVTKTYVPFSGEAFGSWVAEKQLDAVFFNEYGQWNLHLDKEDLPRVAKNMGAKVFGMFVHEKFSPEQTKGFDRVVVPNETGKRVMRNAQVRNFSLIPYSLDIDGRKHTRSTDGKIRFLHVGGFGGFLDRKNSELVLQAFSELEDDRALLTITRQDARGLLRIPPNVKDMVDIVQKNLSQPELTSTVLEHDVQVLPSKWETIGIPALESLSLGVPVITTNIAPMNEYVQTGKNGLLCACTTEKNPEIKIPIAKITVTELKKQMQTMINMFFNNEGMLYEQLSANARINTKKLYDVEKNKHYMLEFLKKELQ